jgi:hypothetical protein
MAPLVYSLQFRGFAALVAADVVEARATAAAGALVTSIGEEGLAGRLECCGSDEAVLESRLVITCDRFDARGELLIGRRNVLRLRSLGTGRLSRTADPELRQGAVVYEVVDGGGQFAGSSGRITSNLLLSDSGDITDTHLGVVFLTKEER